MARLWTTPEDARLAADIITDTWLRIPKRDHAAMRRKLLELIGKAGKTEADCPECEICCAIGVCCPLGSEQQRASLASLLLREAA